MGTDIKSRPVLLLFVNNLNFRKNLNAALD